LIVAVGVAALLAAAAATAAAFASTTAARSSVSAQDVNYLQTSISGDPFEILGGRLACARRATRPLSGSPTG
jgi:hypothetical protein